MSESDSSKKPDTQPPDESEEAVWQRSVSEVVTICLERREDEIMDILTGKLPRKELKITRTKGQGDE